MRSLTLAAALGRYDWPASRFDPGRKPPVPP
ncbi:hypothetical protein Mnod_0777 [Methylobacterium nodulans ORS 2060]|uniref:Uncharacterized protein n=1 Tax=Methylobacterium nodulans (strain LMG 21967 / CNCM I-2342 / ORS 2060) TaxID=460265 RepID=B8IF97_METNO|nr:hypothetical protein Mnod_0777 [Methylobacterium nodulans ORS 2060]